MDKYAIIFTMLIALLIYDTNIYATVFNPIYNSSNTDASHKTVYASNLNPRVTINTSKSQDQSLQVDKYVIELINRKFIPTPGINISGLNLLKPEEGTIHYLLQFYNLTDLNTRRNFMNSSGIMLHDSIGGNAYIASSNLSDVSELTKNRNIRWMGPLLPSDKLSEELKNGTIGKWAYSPDNDNVFLTIQPHSDANFSAIKDTIIDLNGKIINTMPYFPSITASFPLPTLQNATKIIATMDSVQFVDIVDPPLEEQNDGARMAANVSTLVENNTGERPVSGLSGKDVVVFLYDSGIVHYQHPDFLNRIIQIEGSERIRDHSTHVAGTLSGSGNNSGGKDLFGYPNYGKLQQWRGIAPEALIKSFGAVTSDLLYDDGEDLAANFHNVTTSPGSVDLGSISLGNNIVQNGLNCSNLGNYANTAILIDKIVRGEINGIKIPFFQSVGNEVSSIIPPCGTFSTITVPATAKNGIGIGAINSNDNSIYRPSSRGPTDDGRLKPDLVAPGCEIGNDNGIMSTSIGNNQESLYGYTDRCGTSMAAPVAAGVSALVLQELDSLYGSNPEPSTVKALLIHTSTDLGNGGPDYSFGWGSLNAGSAISLIRNDFMDRNNQALRRNFIINSSLDHGNTAVYPLLSDGTRDVKVTIAWDDPPATRLAANTLVNNLDIQLEDPEGIRYSPFVLNHSDPARAAVAGYDETNNVESAMGNRKSGTWLVYVNGASVPTGPQIFTLIGSSTS